MTPWTIDGEFAIVQPPVSPWRRWVRRVTGWLVIVAVVWLAWWIVAVGL